VLIEAIVVDNPLSNVHYLVACPETGAALAIDPLDVDATLALAASRGWTIESVVVTHEHWDHAGGRDAIRAATGARVLAHHRTPLAGIDGHLRGGDVVAVGATVRLQALDTPGHSNAHICLVGGGRLFSGDTVFVGGCGNCRSGDPHDMWKTFDTLLRPLPDAVQLEPGHDYAVNNLRFAVRREPGNPDLRAALLEAEMLASQGDRLRTDLGRERRINPFFRTSEAEVRDGVDLDRNASDEQVFLALRELRNSW
jgi:hydroxyacylglutathione hydrolase